jgi:glutaredoxin
MIIFGTRARYKIVRSGQFFCPHCQTQRQYDHKQGRNYFSLYFIPIFPIGDAGEFIECQTCGRTYAPQVLNFRPSVTTSTADTTRLLNTVKTRLDKGYSIEYIVSDLTGEGLDRDIANNIVNMAISDRRKTCPNCQLTYSAAISQCPECKIALV